jgi:hypothetical protein
MYHDKRLLLISVLLAWIFNGVLFYWSSCTGAYIQYQDVYQNQYAISMEDLLSFKMQFSNLPDTAGEALLAVTQQEEQLQKTLMELYEADQPDEERAKKLYAQQELCRTFRTYLQQLEDYDTHIQEVCEQADTLLKLPMYQNDSYVRRNIIRTRNDYEGLKGLTLSVANVPASQMLFFSKTTDLLALFLTAELFVMAWLLCRTAKTPQSCKGIQRRAVGCLIIGILGMYISDIGLTEHFIGTISFQALIQSLTAFYNSTAIITVGALFAASVLMKLAGCLLLWSGLLSVVTAKGRRRVLLGTGFAAAGILEAVAAFTSYSTAAAEVLREINVCSMFTFERFFVRYLNLNIGGLAVARLPLFLCMAAVLVTGMGLLAIWNLSAYTGALVRETELAYYQEVEKRYEEARKLRHDISNHLLAVQMLIEEGKISQAKRYLSEVSEQNERLAMPVRTGAQVLDALLYKKLEQAGEMNVNLHVEVGCALDKTGISDYALCTIFGNLIDNALEAVKTLSGQPQIDVTIRKQMDMLYIACENPYEGTRRQRGGLFYTTKADSTLHGCGLSSVRDVVRRNGGEMVITTREQKFLVEILMNMVSGKETPKNVLTTSDKKGTASV